MSPHPAGPVGQFFRQQAQAVDPAAKLVGQTHSWIAPVSFLTAQNGFGEEAWIDSMPISVLAVRLSGADVRCCFGKQRGALSRGHSPTLQPKGHVNHFIADGPVRFAQIFLPDDLIDRIGDALELGAPASGRLRDDLAFIADSELDNRCMGYLRAATPQAQPTLLEMEARAILVVERLLGRHHGLVAKPTPKGGLAPWQAARVRELLGDAITDQPTLGTLATEVGLSPFHFARAFHASMGMPPHRYLIELRIERARRLLEDSNLSITEISAEVGYDDPGYLARLFRKHVGTTPTAYRRERRS